MAKVRWLLFVVCTLIFVYGNTKGIAAQDNVRCDFDKRDNDCEWKGYFVLVCDRRKFRG